MVGTHATHSHAVCADAAHAAVDTLVALEDSRADPTGTAGIRRAWRTAAKLRVRLARGAIRQAVMEYDVLGANPSSPLAIHAAEVRLGAFRNLVSYAISHQLEGKWAISFIRRAWAKGLTDAGGGMATAAAMELLLQQELATIAAAVSQSVARIGIRHHPSKSKAWQMAAAIYDKEMNKRLPALIDTLTVQAYNRAKIEGYRARGHKYVGVMPETVPQHAVRDAYDPDEPRDPHGQWEGGGSTDKYGLDEDEQDKMWDWKSGVGYERMRKDSRTGKMLAKLPVFKGTIYRGVNLKQSEYAKLRPGSTYRIDKYSSATSGKSVARNFLGDRNKVSVLLEMKGSGRKIPTMYNTAGSGAEREVVLMRGDRYKVDSVKVRPDYVHVKMRQVK